MTTDMPDYVQTYDRYWRSIVEKNGHLDLDQVQRELHDYCVVMEQVSLAYDDVTGGRISKPNTAAVHVIGEVTERLQQAAEDALKEAVDLLLAEEMPEAAAVVRSLFEEGGSATEGTDQ